MFDEFYFTAPWKRSRINRSYEIKDLPLSFIFYSDGDLYE